WIPCRAHVTISGVAVPDCRCFFATCLRFFAMHISGRVVRLDQQYSLLQRYVLPVAVATAIAVGATGLAAVSTAHNSADDSADALLREGYGLAYNLDHDAAVEALTQAARLVPDEPTAHRGLASIAWLNILFTRGTVTA